LLLLLLGTPVDSNGDDLPSHSGDAPAATQLPNDGKSQWHPFESQAHFELADFIFHQNEMRVLGLSSDDGTAIGV